MNGADLLIQTAVKSGVELCFANPGTTELPLVNALDNIVGMRSVLGLFEGVCTGAADGYGRMTDKPAMTLLHLGPGLANGIANLHNAKRAGSPILNVIGDHATWHRGHDPLLNMDIESLASTFSGWQRTVASSDQIAKDIADAIAAANLGQIATLIVPSDCQWTEIRPAVIDGPASVDQLLDEASIEAAGKKLLQYKKTALVLGGRALRKEGLMAAARIQAKTGCDLLCDTFITRMERGAGLPVVQRIPYLPEMAIDMLKSYECFIFAGTREPVAFFGYKGVPSRLIADFQEKTHIRGTLQNIVKALELLSDSLSATDDRGKLSLASYYRPPLPTGALNGMKACETLAALQPENAIVVDEAITNSLAYYPLTYGCPPFTLLNITGGAIGQGPPCAIGVAMACPNRPVINFQADGSAMYTIQSLWTQAREKLNITTLICSNRSYDILKLELARSGIQNPGENARRMTDLSGIDWTGLAQSQGVPGVSVNTVETFAREFEKSLAETGPHLIELKL